MSILTRSILLSACALPWLTVSLQAAEDFPSRAIRIIVPAPAGGPTDYRTRSVAERLAEALKQPVVVENRVGAAGTIATDYVAKAKPDGYTLLIGHSGTFSYAPYLYAKLPYDPQKDFVPVAGILWAPLWLYVPERSPLHSVQDLLAAAKASPGQLTYGSAGPGSPQHVTMELLKHTAGLDIVHVPYKGSAPLMTDLLSGQIDLAFDAFVPGMEHVAGGRLRVLATSDARRNPAKPEVPTVSEAGLAGFDSGVWAGVFAPAQTPPSVVQKAQSRNQSGAGGHPDCE